MSDPMIPPDAPASLRALIEKWRREANELPFYPRVSVHTQLCICADELQAIADALGRGIAPPITQGWQPIETAPKGGFPLYYSGKRLTSDPAWVEPPRILVVRADGQTAIVYWDWYYAEGGNGYTPTQTAWVDITDEDRPMVRAPLCWMPLPAPPTEPVAQGKGR